MLYFARLIEYNVIIVLQLTSYSSIDRFYSTIKILHMLHKVNRRELLEDFIITAVTIYK